MRSIKTLVLISVISVVYGGSVWPLPQSFSTGVSTINIDPTTFQFTQQGSSDILQSAFDRYMQIIFSRANITATQNPTLSSLDVTLANDNETLQNGIDESYTLYISEDGASIKATNVFGALHGLETFAQIVDFYAGTYSIALVPITVYDEPRFMHRGLLVDSARHFLAISDILRTIDALVCNKMNVLHWHLTDAESFPVQSSEYPSLTEGAYAPEATYSQDDITSVIQYAYERGVRVIPEFDTPGHSYSWGIGYPITANCPGWNNNINNVPLDPSENQTMPIVRAFLTEMTNLFQDEFFHIGGDEVIYGCWSMDESLLQWMNEMGFSSFNQTMQWYERQVWAVMKDQNRTPIVWEEVFNEYGINVPNSVIVEVWKDEPTLLSVAQSGLRGLLGYGWYLDQFQMTWQDFYTHEPFNSSAWTPSLEAFILGGEACAWGELVSGANMDSTIWPKTSAAAERLWSAKSVNDPVMAEPRLVQQICTMNQRGIMAGPIRPNYC